MCAMRSRKSSIATATTNAPSPHCTRARDSGRTDRTSVSAAQILVQSGAGQSARVGTAFGAPLVVKVVDGQGNPFAGALVRFLLPEQGPGAVFGALSRVQDVVTDAQGLAQSPAFTANATAGSYHATASVEGVAQAYRVEPGKSNFGKALFIANTFASNITAGGFLTATIPNPVAIGMMVTAMGGAAVATSWGFWALAALPTTLIVLVGSQYVVRWIFPPEMKDIQIGRAHV